MFFGLFAKGEPPSDVADKAEESTAEASDVPSAEAEKPKKGFFGDLTKPPVKAQSEVRLFFAGDKLK